MRGGMAPPPPPAGYRLVPVTDRAATRAFQVAIHLNASGYSPAALELQIEELRVDFPEFYDDALWAQTRAWAAIRDDAGAGAPAAGGWAGLVGVRPDVKAGGGGVGACAGHLGFLAVAPAHRRHGLGEALLTHALDAAAAAGWATVSLVSLRCRYAPALRLYDRAGFVSTQERHYTGTGALGEWAFDVAWLTLDVRAAWAGRLAPAGPRGSVAPRQVTTTPPVDWPGRAARIRAAAEAEVAAVVVAPVDSG